LIVNLLYFIAFTLIFNQEEGVIDYLEILQDEENPMNDFVPPLEFKRLIIVSTLTSGYQIKSADVNDDGLPDLIAVSTSLPEIFWYKNPEWTKRVLYAGTQGNIDLAPLDIDGDQDIDLAIASVFSLGNSLSGGYVHWLENIDHGQSWKIHFIDSIPTSHRLRWADLDNDDRHELVNLPIIGKGAKSPDYAGGVEFCYYQIPKDPKADRCQKQIIDTSLHMAHGMQLVQWPVPEKWSILTASFEGVHLFTSSIQAKELIWKKMDLGEGQGGIRPKIGSSEIGLGMLNSGEAPFLATIEPWHGDKVVVYRPRSDQESWHREILDSTFRDGHALICADLDQDGNDEIIAGHRGPGYNLYIFQFDGPTRNWYRHNLDPGGMSAAGLCLVDFNADGYLDIAACGSATHNVVLYENDR
jgi:hypothetical protein